MLLNRRSAALPRPGGVLVLAGACFAAGLSAAALIGPVNAGRSPEPPAAPVAALRAGHPATVLRVIDGDTFVARVRVWPGLDITTRVRLRGIDAPELHARCSAEYDQALLARDALARLLAEGAVGVTQVGQDKYGGRVDAAVSTARTPDVSAAMLAGGYARRYDGGRRRRWCG